MVGSGFLWNTHPVPCGYNKMDIIWEIVRVSRMIFKCVRPRKPVVTLQTSLL
jgi:hypothetical protein